jgi:CheY-like chemotaxis protein
MSATILVAGLDLRGLLLEAPLLRREGYSIAEHASAFRLTEDLVSGDARLVVLGTHLHDLSPALAVRTIRSFPVTRHVSVLCLIPANEAPPLDGKLMEAGANAVLRRPLDVVSLEYWLAKLLSVAHRVDVRLPVEGQVVGSTRSQPMGHFCAQTCNVSVHGLLLASPVRLNVGDDLELDLRLTPEHLPLQALGRVVRATGDLRWPYLGFGVEFLYISPLNLQLIDRLVQRGRKPPRTPVRQDKSLIQSTLRRNHWIFEIRQPAPAADGWQVEIRRAPEGLWRPGNAGPFFVVSAATPKEALHEAQRFLRQRT